LNLRLRNVGGGWGQHEIAKIRDGVGGVGDNCIEERVLKKVENELYSYFLYDLWLGGTFVYVV